MKTAEEIVEYLKVEIEALQQSHTGERSRWMVGGEQALKRCLSWIESDN